MSKPLSERLIDVTPIREAFLASGLTTSEVCRRLGWIDKRGVVETSRLKRNLGLAPLYSDGKKRAPIRRIDMDLAARIVGAMGLDPWEVGL